MFKSRCASQVDRRRRLMVCEHRTLTVRRSSLPIWPSCSTSCSPCRCHQY